MPSQPICAAPMALVAGGYVGDDGAEGVEGGIVAFLYLPLHVLGYLVHGHVAGTFDESLYVLCPRPLYQLAHGVQLGELGGVIGVTDGSGTQTVTQRQGHIVLCTDVADVVEMLVEETLAVVCQAP